MTYEEFFTVVEKIYGTKEYSNGKKYLDWDNGTEDYYEVKWETGGASGGSCWGDEAEEHSCSEPEPELDFIDLFEHLCPNITFLKYKKVMKDLIEYDMDSRYEYYGNYTTYGVKRVQYKRLYEKLKSNGVI